MLAPCSSLSPTRKASGGGPVGEPDGPPSINRLSSIPALALRGRGGGGGTPGALEADSDADCITAQQAIDSKYEAVDRERN